MIKSIIIHVGEFMSKDWPEMFVEVSGYSIESWGFVIFHCL